MNTSRNHALFVIALWAVIPLGLLAKAAVSLWVDPLQIYHDQRSAIPQYHHDERWQTPGLVRKYFQEERSKKTAILGTSMLRNSLASETERYARLPDALNLVISGAHHGELTATLGMLKESSLEHVVLSLDNTLYFDNGTPRYNPTSFFPDYLYTANSLSKLQAFFNDTVWQMASDILAKNFKYLRDLETRAYWMADSAASKGFTRYVEANLPVFAREYERKREAIGRECREILAGDPRSCCKDIALPPQTELVLDTIAGMKNVDFHILIPPNATVMWALDERKLRHHVCILRLLVQRLEKIPNAKLYAFSDMGIIGNNLANYYDDLHYGLGVNRYMLKAIGQQKHIINAATIDAYVDGFVRNIMNFRVYSDPSYTVTFEGPMDEKAFSVYPPPEGPQPLEPGAPRR